MKDNILVDTCIWIEFFKDESDTSDELVSLIIKNAVATCGIILFELMQGIKTEHEKSSILNIMTKLPYFEMSPQLWQKAAELSRILKKKGLSVPLSDIFIATIAITHDLQIFTIDKHFNLIPGVKLYQHTS